MSSQRIKPDIMVASMPPNDLAHEAVRFAKKQGIPVLVDIRDEWPDLFLHFVPAKLQKIVRLFLFRDFQMIKYALSRADGLIAMMNSLLVWGLGYAGRVKTSFDSVYYLGGKKNSVPVGLGENLRFMNDVKNKFIITFIGTFVRHNTPLILLECAEKLKDRNIHFVLAGDGELFQEIKERASKLPNVSLPGWLNQSEIYALLQFSHIGICPSAQPRAAFPNKAFTYLSAGLPVISAFSGDLKKLIEEYQIGFYYPPNDSDALVKCIEKLFHDPLMYKKMSENAQSVFEKMFDADKIYDEYAKHIEWVVRNYHS
jgi:glycosyltransferase involved in cell wall biosynthesis